MSPEEIPALLEQLRPYLAEVCEVSLADWQDNPNSGAWVKLRLPDETHLEIYRGKNRAGRTQKFGQRYTMMLIEINDDETPINHEARQRMEQGSKPRKLSQIAGGICHDANFRQWVAETYGEDCPDVEAAAAFIRSMCGVESRALLDHNKEAAEIFRTILGDFDAWKQTTKQD